MLYRLETVHVGIADECYSHSVSVGTGRTTYTMNIILCIMRHIVVDHDADIIDVDATGHDVGSHKDIRLARLELEHHLVALLLGEVAMHLSAIDIHLAKLTGYILHLFLLTRENDDTLKVARLEEMLDEKTFFRCSKSVIVNLDKITKLKPEVTRNILATLTNGEVIVISRRYVRALKDLIGLEG